jgi:hypothetical protein
MKHDIPMKCGDEFDVFSRWRHLLCYTQHPGVTKKVKRRYNKRSRHDAKIKIQGEL